MLGAYWCILRCATYMWQLYYCIDAMQSNTVMWLLCVTSLWLVALCAGWRDDGPDSTAPKPPRVMCERWTQPHRHKVAVNILKTEVKCQGDLTKSDTGLSWNCYSNSLPVAKVLTLYFGWKSLEVKVPPKSLCAIDTSSNKWLLRS